MRCYRHPANEAVGLCKNCSRGVCLQCVVEVDDSLACKGRCEQKVAELNQLLRRAPETHRTNALNFRRSGLTAFVMGLLMCCMGALFIKFAHNEFGNTIGYIFAALGGLYALNGVLVIRTARKFDFPKSAVDAENQEKTYHERFGR